MSGPRVEGKLMAGSSQASWTMRWLVFLFGVQLVNGQMDCSKAPSASLRTVCEQINNWDKNARASPVPNKNGIVLPPGINAAEVSAASFEIPQVAATAEQCMTLGQGSDGTNQCTLSNGQSLQKSLRREYRTLSDEERERFHAAFLGIKKNGAFDEIARLHAQFAESGAAHAGPAFLPWHREFIKRMEIALRKVDPGVSLPYWDSVMDSYLPKPSDSIIWTDAFMGNNQGSVTSGPFINWPTIERHPTITRKVGAEGSVFNETNIIDFISFTDINKVLAPTAPRAGCPSIPTFSAIEYTHGNVHLYVGGDMHETGTSANDPIFYLHHSFVDLIWEAWRLAHQDRDNREHEYPLDNNLCSSNFHFSSAYMEPFRPWRNSDGLSNMYTDNMYEFAPRPSCPSCGNSKYLFCMRSRQKCASKVRPGGVCRGLDPAEQPCYNGACQNGVCVSTGPNEPTTRRPPIPSKPPVGPKGQDENCFNSHQCCSVWSSSGECNRNPGYMRGWCKASCGICKPKHYQLSVGKLLHLKRFIVFLLECNDRHVKCSQWSKAGECAKNFQWMAENCRKSCGMCAKTRAQSCPGGKASNQRPPTPTLPTITPGSGATSSCTSPGCFNENMCCQYWGRRGECNKNTVWMTCNCRVSCGMCFPNYIYGFGDHHEKCPQWAASGECDKNTWMLENCKLSCQSMYTNRELTQLCRTYKGRRPARSAGMNFMSSGSFLAAVGLDHEMRGSEVLDLGDVLLFTNCLYHRRINLQSNLNNLSLFVTKNDRRVVANRLSKNNDVQLSHCVRFQASGLFCGLKSKKWNCQQKDSRSYESTYRLFDEPMAASCHIETFICAVFCSSH
ncbi:Protein CBR-TYR-3 [Aphelenchoides besseyi]|nr:Protein CBR-TYR-3 [Aphelenchoides besseyi]